MDSEIVYSRLRGRWPWLYDSYVGGWRYDEPSSSTIGSQVLTIFVTDRDQEGNETRRAQQMQRRSYLVPYPGETPDDYDTRLRLALYVNVCEPIVDAYVDAITPSVKRKLGPLESLLKSVDGEGKPWAQLVDEVGRWTAVYGFVATVLDASVTPQVQSLAQEQASGSSLRVIVVHPPAIAWVSRGEDGALDEFAFVESPFVASGVSLTKDVCVWVWTRNEWMRCTGTVATSKTLLEQRSALKIEARGKHGTPGTVPVAFAYHKRDTAVQVPLGTSLIDDAAKCAQLIFNELSRVEEYHRKAPPFLAVPSGEANGRLPAETELQLGPSNAFGFASTAGAPSWVSPSAEMPAEVRAHCMFLFSLALRTAGLEVAADSSAQVQSGEALRIRSRDFESRAKRFASSLEAWELRMLALAQQWTGVVGEVSITYPERYLLPDLSESLAQSIALIQTFGDKLGTRGASEVLRQALRSALALSDREVEQIVAEATQQALAEAQAREVAGMQPPQGDANAVRPQ